MQIDALWQQHTFHVLLDDFVKARKKGEELGKMRLKILLDYIGDQGGILFAIPELAEAKPKAVKQGPTIRISDSAAPATHEELAEMDRRDAINKVNADQARAEKLARVAEAVKKVFDQGGNTVQVPKDMVVSEIEPFLKSQGIHFSSLEIGLPATEPGSPARYWNLRFER